MLARKQANPSLRRNKKSPSLLQDCVDFGVPVVGILSFLCLAFAGFVYEFYRDDTMTFLRANSNKNNAATTTSKEEVLPVLPIFTPVPNAETRIQETLAGNPSIAGITAILQRFIAALHDMNYRYVASENIEPKEIVESLFHLTEQHLGAFDQVYRDQPIFPIRDDESIFLSLAAFREHLLADTLKYAFENAKFPDKLFVGAVVQNCFGKVLSNGTIDTAGLPCKTGAQVIGKNKAGRDMTKVSDAPPDVNGIVDFCAMTDFEKYCQTGQIRVLYIHETESLGPAMARYYASKLWAGETYFMQTDSHLEFAPDWDDKFRAEIKATRNYPKSVLSSYPPGFGNGLSTNGKVKESKGARLCTCTTIKEDPNPIVRINTGVGYSGNEPRPTQIPFIAAGFFFAHAHFLVDVPFDPYMPWLFMGEEIALSMRAWTHGWNIYAPRVNLIAHQYRPGRMGLPKFWGTVNRLFGGKASNTALQRPVIKRVKHMVGYPDSTLDKIKAEGIELVLKDVEHYGLGKERSWKEYLEFAHLSIDEEHDVIVCSKNTWCNQGLKD